MRVTILLLSFCLFCCNGNPDNKQQKFIEGSSREPEKLSEIKKETTVSQHEVYDTSNVYRMNDKQIVFFSITQEEFDSAMAKSTQPIELNDSIADFHSYVYVTRGKLAKTTIKIGTTQRRFFKIKTLKGEVIFDRKRNNKHFGIIFSDCKKEPIIKEGIILKEQDYRNMVSEYFNIELPVD